MVITGLEIREARREDVDAIALAHRDSIQSLGPTYYPSTVVDDWQEGLSGNVYLNAMQNGEVFFIATGNVDSGSLVLGFASDYRIEGSTHGTSAYVRGIAARQGIGSRLLLAAESHAKAAGATCINVEASLAAVEFYKANGFVEIGRGETHLMSGRPIACVFMRKEVAGTINAPPD
jgi:putative acetyltransferase